ncbi:MAG: hypothetical protein IPM06_21745 [Rhizobiales bacterium]|nr:hypothetical protein [Hyphomicrobiales bacterium]
MILIGLAGKAGSGKDSVADYLVRHYGFIKFSFADALRREVAAAFGVVDGLLRDRDTKEEPCSALALRHCFDAGFVPIARAEIAKWHHDSYFDLDALPLSPRQVLQWWGSEFRRAQNLGYWLDRADIWIDRVRSQALYPEFVPQLFVCSDVRFANEREWVHMCGGNVWHVYRDSVAAVCAHESENPLPVLAGEREIFNYHTLEYLHKGVDQLLSSAARFVRMEPPAPMTEPQFPDFDNLDG